MHILIDNSEQLAYTFTGIVPRPGPWEKPSFERRSLYTADYQVYPSCCRGIDCSCRDPENARLGCVIERKTLSDLYGTVTRGRDRFEKELRRMSLYGFAAIVVEAEWTMIANPNSHLAHPTETDPKSVIGSLLAWNQRFGVHVYCLPNRAAAERVTYRILERWYRDQERATKLARGEQPNVRGDKKRRARILPGTPGAGSSSRGPSP